MCLLQLVINTNIIQKKKVKNFKMPSLQTLYISYGSYHHNPMQTNPTHSQFTSSSIYSCSNSLYSNKAIHIVCIPLILISAIALIQHTQFNLMKDSELGLSLIVLSLINIYYVYVDREAGTVAAIMYTMMWWSQKQVYLFGNRESHFKIALFLHIVCWLLQFIGHGVFESKAASYKLSTKTIIDLERKPALLDNILQVFSAPLFVVVELLTMVGWRKEESLAWEKQIEANVKAFKAKDAEKTKST